jgi:hypothetical protein
MASRRFIMNRKWRSFAIRTLQIGALLSILACGAGNELGCLFGEESDSERRHREYEELLRAQAAYQATVAQTQQGSATVVVDGTERTANLPPNVTPGVGAHGLFIEGGMPIIPDAVVDGQGLSVYAMNMDTGAGGTIPGMGAVPVTGGLGLSQHIFLPTGRWDFHIFGGIRWPGLGIKADHIRCEFAVLEDGTTTLPESVRVFMLPGTEEVEVEVKVRQQNTELNVGLFAQEGPPVIFNPPWLRQGAIFRKSQAVIDRERLLILVGPRISAQIDTGGAE